MTIFSLSDVSSYADRGRVKRRSGGAASSSLLFPVWSTLEDIAHALQRVTTPSSPIEEAVSRVSQAVTQQASRLSVRHLDAAPLPEPLVNRILWFLFPDARPEDYEPCKGEMEEIPMLKWLKAKEFVAQTKASAPYSSMTHRLAIAVAAVNYGFKGGLSGVAFIWQEFCLELRYRWEHSVPIPLLQRTIPDMGSCLLHQKLQLLNCCLERKRAREKQQQQQQQHHQPLRGLTPSKQQSRRRDDNNSEDSEDDDDFFECSESLEDYSFISSPVEEELPKDVDEGEGRLRPCGDLKLFNRPDRLLYIPITQDPSPMTEDMLQEHAEVLTRLGSGPEGAHLRAQMQSASLLSDMEAFKAANPGCVLEDFVRWYSPRDFVEPQPTQQQQQQPEQHPLSTSDVAGDDTSGVCSLTKEENSRRCLSSRMLVEGNIWMETWTQARAVPAKRQRRLFDDTREAEKVLHYLANLKPGEACRLLLPCLLQASVIEIHERSAGVKGDIPELNSLLDSIVSRTILATRASSLDVSATGGDAEAESLNMAEEVVTLIDAAETTIARAQSLRFKLEAASGDPEAIKEIDRFVFQLLEAPEVDVPGAGRGHVGQALRKLMSNDGLFGLAATTGSGERSDVRHENAEMEPMTSAKTQPIVTPTPDSFQLFPAPSAKEYIFRVQVPRPSLFSRALPQRMFAVVVAANEFRIAGAFAQDTVFF